MTVSSCTSSVLPCTTCLVDQYFKELLLCVQISLCGASVSYSPCKTGGSLSRLRVQRYGDFFIPASVSRKKSSAHAKKIFHTLIPSRAFLYNIILERPLHRNRRDDEETVVDAFIGPYEILGDLHLCADAPFGIVVDAGQVPEVHP